MRHEVTFSIPEQEVDVRGVDFVVTVDDRKLGTLRVSKASIVWIPKDHTYGYRMPWKDFDSLLRDKGVKDSA